MTRARCACPLGLKTVGDDDDLAWARRPSVGMGKRWDIAVDIVACIAPGEDEDEAGETGLGRDWRVTERFPCEIPRVVILRYE